MSRGAYYYVLFTGYQYNGGALSSHAGLPVQGLVVALFPVLVVIAPASTPVKTYHVPIHALLLQQRHGPVAVTARGLHVHEHISHGEPLAWWSSVVN